MPFLKKFDIRFGFAAGFLSGLAAPTYVYSTVNYLEPDAGVLEMRADWVRIGEDFRAVMTREDVKTPPSP